MLQESICRINLLEILNTHVDLSQCTEINSPANEKFNELFETSLPELRKKLDGYRKALVDADKIIVKKSA